VTANHNCQAHQHAFHTLRRQANGWDGCYLAGSKSLPVAKPENRAISFLVLPPQLVSESCRSAPAEIRWLTASKLSLTVVFGVDLRCFPDCFRLARAPFCRPRGLEMIVDDIRRHHFQNP